VINFIDKVAVANFRCLPDQDVGPFGVFNLIFGSNGSGKTSLFEAIEIGLTGSSARVGMREDMQKVVSRHGNAEVTVYGADEKVLGRFLGGKLEGGPQAQIRALFDLNVRGQKASYLLPRLFRIHNILYSETIVSFLRAEYKSDLNAALVELAAGAETVQTWNKLEAASRHASAMRKELETKLARSDQEVQRLQTIVSELASQDEEHLQKYGHKLVANIPKDLWDDGKVPPVEPFAEFLVQVSRVAPRLSNTLDMLEEMAKSEAVTEMKTLKSINKSKEAAETAVDDARRSRDELKKKLNKYMQSRMELQKSRKHSRKRVSALKSTKEGCTSIVEFLEILREWAAEMRAYQLDKELQIKKATLSEACQCWTEIDVELRSLPSIDFLVGKMVEHNRLKDKASSLKKKADKAITAERENQTSLTETEELLRSSRESWSAVQEAVRDLYVQLHSLHDLYPSRECPACGHDWESEQGLAAATSRHFEKLSDILGKPSENLATLLSTRDKLQAALQKVAKERKLITKKQSVVEDQLGTIEDELHATIARANQILKAVSSEDSSIDTTPLELETIGDKYKNFPFEKIRSQVRSSKAALEAVESRLRSLWDDIRLEEFLKQKDKFEDHAVETSTMLKTLDLDLELPKDWDISALIALGNSVSAELHTTNVKLAELNREFEAQEKQLAQLDESLRVTRNELKDDDKLIEERAEEYSKVNHVANLAEKLASLGLINRRGSLQLEKSRGTITDAKEDAAYLVEEGPRYVKKLQEESRVREELDRAQNAANSADRDFRAAQQLEEKFSSLPKPGSAETNTLVSMAGSVSEIFRRLHWPFDFVNVEFEDLDGRLEVLVEPRFAPGDRIPAHQRLSAGQRAALAVSVFWTLNTSRESVPKVMLMDEPVQNIDEINALNFLDSLRWLVERGGRQVFFATSSRRLAGLVRKKFAYLEHKFVEVDLERRGEVGEVVVNRDFPRGRRAKLSRASS